MFHEHLKVRYTDLCRFIHSLQLNLSMLSRLCPQSYWRERGNSCAPERAEEKRAWLMGARPPPELGSLYRMLAIPRSAVLCHFPALSLPALVERGDEQEHSGWLGCGA